MSIVSSPFGPTILSGEDATKFLEQVNDPYVDKDTLLKLQQSFERGRKSLSKMEIKNGEKIWVLN